MMTLQPCFVRQRAITNPLIICMNMKRSKWPKNLERVKSPQVSSLLQFRTWPLGLGSTMRVITSVWHTKLQYSALLFSIPFSSSPSRFVFGGRDECQVQLRYQLSRTGVRSKRDSEKSEIHTSTPERTKTLQSNPPPSGVVMGPADYPSGSQQTRPSWRSNITG